MKKTIARISVLFLLVVVSLSTVSMAQPHGRYYSGRRGAPSHYRSHGSGFHRAVDDLDAVATGALAMYALGSLDDYTGLRFGLNSASLRTDGISNVDENKKSGVDLGIVFGWYLGNTPFILEPGVFYSFKGGKYGYNDLRVEHNMHMLEFPFVLKCEIPLVPGNIALQPFAGCFFSTGFAGKTTYDGEKYDTFDDNELNSFDGGLRFGCGLCLSRFYAEFAYDLGLSNVSNYDVDLNTRTMSLNIGFNF